MGQPGSGLEGGAARVAAPRTWLLRLQDAGAPGPGVWVWPARPAPAALIFLPSLRKSRGAGRGARGRAP